MGEVALARLWQLPDGMCCLLFKDVRSETWEVRVVQDGITIRSERFSNPITAMNDAKSWRMAYAPSADQLPPTAET